MARIYKPQAAELVPFALLLRKFGHGCAAQRAGPIIGQIGKQGAGFDAVFRDAGCLVINKAAY